MSGLSDIVVGKLQVHEVVVAEEEEAALYVSWAIAEWTAVRAIRKERPSPPSSSVM